MLGPAEETQFNVPDEAEDRREALAEETLNMSNFGELRVPALYAPDEGNTEWLANAPALAA